MDTLLIPNAVAALPIVKRARVVPELPAAAVAITIGAGSTAGGVVTGGARGGH